MDPKKSITSAPDDSALSKAVSSSLIAVTAIFSSSSNFFSFSALRALGLTGSVTITSLASTAVSPERSISVISWYSLSPKHPKTVIILLFLNIVSLSSLSVSIAALSPWGLCEPSITMYGLFLRISKRPIFLALVRPSRISNSSISISMRSRILFTASNAVMAFLIWCSPMRLILTPSILTLSVPSLTSKSKSINSE